MIEIPAATSLVMYEVAQERAAQDEKWGEQNHPDVDPVPLGRPGGCTPQCMAGQYEIPTASRARSNCQEAARNNEVTWADILVEEVAEAIEQATIGNEVALRHELVQVAAVAVAQIEAIDRRSAVSS